MNFLSGDNKNKRPVNLDLNNIGRPLSPTSATPSRNGGRSPSPRRHARSAETDKLIEDVETVKPPMAGNEIDDFDDDNRETVHKPYPGVDDGFFSPDSDKNHRDVEDIPVLTNRAGEGTVSGDIPVDDQPDMPQSPFPNGRFPRVPDSEFGGLPPESIPDVNVYQQKKTLAQGMMDLALFSANANQLRYVLESVGHPYYYPGLVMIGFSLILQVFVGIGLIWNSRYNVKDKKEICIANKVSNFTIIGIFLVTVINVFISAFGTTSIVNTGQVASPFPISTRGGIMDATSDDPK